MGSFPHPLAHVDAAKILGITLAADIKESRNLTFQPIVQSIKQKCFENKSRILCLKQKIWFIKTYVLSKLWYAAQVLAVPQQFIRQIQSTSLYYIWSGSLFRVPYTTLVRPCTEGGLEMVDIKQKCKALLNSRQMGISSKQLYQEYCSHEPRPIPRVMEKNPNILWDKVWKNITSKVLTAEVQSAWYKAVHDLIPTRLRLHRIQMSPDDRCQKCNLNVPDSLQHRLTGCKQSKQIWRILAAHLTVLYQTGLEGIQPNILLYPQFTFRNKEKLQRVTYLIAQTVFFLTSQDRSNDEAEEEYRIFIANLRLP